MADEQMVERAREYLDIGGKEYRRLGIVQPHYLAEDVVALMAAFVTAERARWLEEAYEWLETYTFPARVAQFRSHFQGEQLTAAETAQSREEAQSAFLARGGTYLVCCERGQHNFVRLNETTVQCTRCAATIERLPDATAELQFAELFEAENAWADKAFPSESRDGPLKHLRREVDELLTPEGIGDLEEYADALLLLLNATHRAGFDAQQLLRAGHEKLKKNQARQWSPPDADGVVEHVRKV